MGMATGVAPNALIKAAWALDGVRIFMPLMSSMDRIGFDLVIRIGVPVVQIPKILTRLYSGAICLMAFQTLPVQSTESPHRIGSSDMVVRGNSFDV